MAAPTITYPFCSHCGWDIQRSDLWSRGICDACGADMLAFSDFTVATTASAGIPGTWDENLKPNTVAEANAASITASPATLWTVGQYVVLGDGTSHMYWDSTTWVAGEAPV